MGPGRPAERAVSGPRRPRRGARRILGQKLKMPPQPPPCPAAMAGVPECRLISLSEQPFDIAIHPTRQLAAAAIITGHVETFDFSPPAVGRLASRLAHDGSCRAVRFLPGGAVLLSAGSDGLLAYASVERGKVQAEVKEAHGCAINKLEVISEVLTASGAAAALARRPPSPLAQATTRGTCGCGTVERTAAPPRSECTKTLWRTCTLQGRRGTRCSQPPATARWRTWTCAATRWWPARTTRRTSCCQARARLRLPRAPCLSRR